MVTGGKPRETVGFSPFFALFVGRLYQWLYYRNLTGFSGLPTRSHGFLSDTRGYSHPMGWQKTCKISWWIFV